MCIKNSERLVLPRYVKIREVGPRDGFQNEAAFVPTEVKIEAVNRLSRAGFTEIQTTAFVHPKAVPNMRDAEQVLAGLARNPKTEYTALVPNLRGYIRAAEAGVKKVELTLSATDSHNISNMNATTAQSVARLRECMALGLDTQITIGIAVAFFCPFEGVTPYEKLHAVVEQVAESGVVEIGLGDTAGRANPAQVYEYIAGLRNSFPQIEFLFHAHNTFGCAMANNLAAMQAGVTTLDASAAGLGGCPFSPGASGNVATEDLAQCLAAMGVETNLDLEAVIDAAQFIRDAVGHADSHTLRVGRFNALCGCEAHRQHND